MKWAEDISGVKMLTPEYEVTAIFFDVDRIAPLDMLPHFSGSNASFFKILKALEAKDVISAEANPSDGRSKLYRLSDNALNILAGQWMRYREAGHEKLYASDEPSVAIRKYTKTVTQDLKVKQFTCEFQILLYINVNPGLTNIRFHDLIDLSQAKFNMSLTSLQKSEHIYYERDQADGRKKLYYLSKSVQELFDEMDKRIFHWLDSRADVFDKLQYQAPSGTSV